MAELMTLSASERERYARQLSLPELGIEGQLALKRAKVLIVGLGGLGSPLSAYLAGAGVGTIGLVDDDVVVTSNLPRQILYATTDANRPKVWAAKARLAAMNPEIVLHGHEEALDVSNAGQLLEGYDLVADATDNFAARYALTDAAWRRGLPVVHASLYRHEGQLAVFKPGESPCYRCHCPDPPLTAIRCADAGVLGVLPGLLGVMQATEVLKLLLGIGRPLVGSLLIVESLAMRFTELRMARDPACLLCGEPSAASQGLALQTVSAGRPEADLDLDAPELAALGGAILVDVREVPETEALAGMRHVPLSRLLSDLSDWEVEGRYVLVCEHGVESLHAARMLRGAGLPWVWSLRGGARALGRFG